MNSFYYDHEKLQKLVLLNAILLSMVILIGNGCREYMWVTSVVAVLCLISFSASLYIVIL